MELSLPQLDSATVRGPRDVQRSDPGNTPSARRAQKTVETAIWDITVPVHASASSQSGVAYAIELGRCNATLHFCSVVDATEACLSAANDSTIDPGPIVREMHDDAQSICDYAVAQAHESGIAADGKVIFGEFGSAINRYVHERTSNLLVIGTYAGTGPTRGIAGSAAEHLMRTSRVPVVVAHVNDIAEVGPIFIALDGTPAASAALRVAINFARAQCRSLAITNVVNGGSASRLILRDAAELAREAGINFELLTLDGPAAEEIVAAAQRQHSSMIVLGTSGSSVTDRTIAGDVAASVIERALVPVTVVRANDRAARIGTLITSSLSFERGAMFLNLW
jgi:nucleotide-binding universal stress UspA family protein